jgi:hypothetical protein
MRREITCKCGVDTWYEDSSNVNYVDAWRALQSKCKCGGEE